MIKRFYIWLRVHFLPEWARRQLMEENQRLQRKIAELRQENQRLEAYIEGMQDSLRRQRNVIIYDQVEGGDGR